MSYEGKRPVTLEDLLRLKRAERPPAEFWAQFDRQLRAKQLAALVEKRPWWRTRVFAGWSRIHLPLGAAAVLALTFVTVRDFSIAPLDLDSKSVEASSAAVALSPAAISPGADVQDVPAGIGTAAPDSEAAPAETPTTAALPILSASSRHTLASACASGDASAGRAVRR